MSESVTFSGIMVTRWCWKTPFWKRLRGSCELTLPRKAQYFL